MEEKADVSLNKVQERVGTELREEGNESPPISYGLEGK